VEPARAKVRRACGGCSRIAPRLLADSLAKATSPSNIRDGNGILAGSYLSESNRNLAVDSPDLARALELYDRWLPGTMRRIAGITRTCVPQCVMLRRSW
jgi:hypothetical protein